MNPVRRRTLQCLRSAFQGSQIRRVHQSKIPRDISLVWESPKYPGKEQLHTFGTHATKNTKVKSSNHSDTGIKFVEINGYPPFHPAFLRDACQCGKCVDPSSKQKNFQTTDIPENIEAKTVEILSYGSIEVTWENDLLGFEQDHRSVFPKKVLVTNSSSRGQRELRWQFNSSKALWNKEKITKELEYVNYEEYMKTDEGLFRAVQNLHSHGLLLVRGVPESEKSVEEIANRIGNLRDTFYGRTWDVKSVPQAKNVAYTAQYLGLHMDLLYMSDPPGFQFLHCLQNTCEGGSSLFSDAMYAVSKLSSKSFTYLANNYLAYHYKNAGEHYYFEHPLVQVPISSQSSLARNEDEALDMSLVDYVNYSPPFQANHVVIGSDGRSQHEFSTLLNEMKKFSELVESEENLYEYRLQEGECVIFNNRRVLHGRRQFDTSTGNRWLKGAYIDTDVFMSKYRVLSEKFVGMSKQTLDESRKLVAP